MQPTTQKYAVGDLVTAISIPSQQLRIRRFVDRIYYCRIVDAPDAADLVYFERELQKS